MPDTIYTPGPWRVAPPSEYRSSDLNVDAGTRAFICCAGTWGDKEAEANAALIAAAPELLEALRDAADAIQEEVSAAGDDDHPTIRKHAAVVQKCRAAVAKAEGRAS